MAAIALEEETIELGRGREHVRRSGDILHPVGKGCIRRHEKYEYVRRCGVCSGEMWNFLTRLVPFNSAAFRSTTYAKELTKQSV